MTCVLCQDTFGDKECESLLCGHTLHSSCLADYIEATGKAKALCCPFKCRANNVSFGELSVVIEGDDGDVRGGAASEATIVAAHDAHEAAAQMFE